MIIAIKQHATNVTLLCSAHLAMFTLYKVVNDSSGVKTNRLELAKAAWFQVRCAFVASIRF
jgi:transcriptional regulator of met regulon